MASSSTLLSCANLLRLSHRSKLHLSSPNKPHSLSLHHQNINNNGLLSFNISPLRQKSTALRSSTIRASPAPATISCINQTIGWTDSAVAAIVPGMVSLVVVPLLLYVIHPPSAAKSSPDAPKLAREKMGPIMTKNEIIMAATLLLTNHDFGKGKRFISYVWC